MIPYQGNCNLSSKCHQAHTFVAFKRKTAREKTSVGHLKTLSNLRKKLILALDLLKKWEYVLVRGEINLIEIPILGTVYCYSGDLVLLYGYGLR